MGQQIRVEGDFSAAALVRTGDFCDAHGPPVTNFGWTFPSPIFGQHGKWPCWRNGGDSCTTRGRRLILLNPSAAVRYTLQLLRLTGYFRIDVPSSKMPPEADAEQAVIPPYPGGHTLAWQGEVTTVNAESVWGLTRQHLTAVGPPPRQTFIIDLSQLRFIDSAGAELMRRLRKWAASSIWTCGFWFPGRRAQRSPSGQTGRSRGGTPR